MATCRIFAGATVTNISDKIPPAATFYLRPTSCALFRPVPAPRSVSLYIDLPRTDTPPVSYFRSKRECVISIRGTRHVGHRRELFATFIARFFPQRIKTGRTLALCIDLWFRVWDSLRSRIFLQSYIYIYIYTVLATCYYWEIRCVVGLYKSIVYSPRVKLLCENSKIFLYVTKVRILRQFFFRRNIL